MFRPGTANLALAESGLVHQHQLRVGTYYSHVFQGFSATVSASEVAALRSDRSVEGVYADGQVRVSGQQVPAGIRRVQADVAPASRIGTRTAVDADIAIIDTGVAHHPDLNLVGGVNCAPEGPCTTGGYGDGYGHGTHVAGIAAAKDNGFGVVGAAPGARIWSVKVFNDEGSGTFSAVVAGLDWVVARGDIEVANASLSGGNNEAVTKAVAGATAAGVVVVVAAGNEHRNAAHTSPANAPSAITVSAYVDTDGRPGGDGSPCEGDADDTRWRYSNFGAVVDVAAPGACVRSTFGRDGYGRMSGTSMAAPHVAGAAAVYIRSHVLYATPDRAELVRMALRGRWGASQTSPCGFAGGVSSEPVLVMGGCGKPWVR